jgi:hypothetical protein
MSSIEVKNLNPWLAKTQAARNKIRSSATDYVKKKVTQVFKTILKESPQYSGDFVSNWDIITNRTGYIGYAKTSYKQSMDSVYENLKTKDTNAIRSYYDMVRQAGHPDAMVAPLRNGLEVIDTIKWNTKIIIRNTSPAAKYIKTGEMEPRYRPVHRHLEGVAFVDYILQKYKYNWIK